MTEALASTTSVPNRDRLPLLALLGANTVSLVGSMTTSVALPWFVLETTGSPARAGVSGFSIALPRVLMGLFGGALIDRLGYKRTSALADTVSGVGIALVPLLYHSVGLAFWQLVACVFIGALLDIPGLTARRSLLPELGGGAGLRLERVSAAYEANQNLAQLLGPPLAGVLVVWLGASNVLWFDAASFAFSAACVTLAVPALRRGAAPAARGRYLDELGAGLRFMRRDSLLLGMAVGVAFSNLLGAPLFTVILPVYVRSTSGSAADLGLISGAIGGGTLAGAALFGMVGHRLSRRLVWLAFFLVEPVNLWVLLLRSPLPVLMATFALVGVALGPVNPLLVTVRLERIPAELRGRAISTFTAIASGLLPIGMLAGGSLVAAAGFRPSVLLLAACSQLVGVGTLFVPAYRHMEAPARSPLDLPS